MFLEIKGIKKHYGEGESRVEVLNGLVHQVLVNQHCLILSVVLMMQTRVTYL